MTAIDETPSRRKKKPIMGKNSPSVVTNKHKSVGMDLLLHLLITTTARHFTVWYKKFYNKQFRNGLPRRKMLFLSQKAEL